MPTSNEEFLQNLVTELRAENAALLEVILKQQNLLSNDEVVINQLSDNQVLAGKKPWYMLKRELERSSRKPRLSELAGIPEPTEELA